MKKVLIVLFVITTVMVFGQAKPQPAVTPQGPPKVTTDQKTQLLFLEREDARDYAKLLELQIQVNQLTTKAKDNTMKLQYLLDTICQSTDGVKYTLDPDTNECAFTPDSMPVQKLSVAPGSSTDGVKH